jgi:hypothetical protein
VSDIIFDHVSPGNAVLVDVNLAKRARKVPFGDMGSGFPEPRFWITKGMVRSVCRPSVRYAGAELPNAELRANLQPLYTTYSRLPSRLVL